MASYKIYFLDFFHKNHPPSSRNWPSTLQNAIGKPDFIKKVDFGRFSRDVGALSSVEQLQFFLDSNHCIFHAATARPDSPTFPNW